MYFNHVVITEQAPHLGIVWNIMSVGSGGYKVAHVWRLCEGQEQRRNSNQPVARVVAWVFLLASSWTFRVAFLGLLFVFPFVSSSFPRAGFAVPVLKRLLCLLSFHPWHLGLESASPTYPSVPLDFLVFFSLAAGLWSGVIWMNRIRCE